MLDNSFRKKQMDKTAHILSDDSKPWDNLPLRFCPHIVFSIKK